ncbi:transposase, partial [Pseudogemmobacter sonorensis]|uniref:transposase n=1 Tax=Pseudogemmobacter sonorensis TaxID=2989681 RepID=UPI0036870B50
MSRPSTPTYETLNWPEYNKALKRRGSLTIWFDPGVAWAALPTGKRGRQPVYTDAAIQTCLTMKVLFGMALRQTAGLVEGGRPAIRKFGQERPSKVQSQV